MRLGTAQKERVIGALVGLATGDALGAGYEFGPGPAEPEMIGGGGPGWEPGEWTDDTSMAICIAEVAASGTLDPIAVGNRFLEWVRSHPKDVGRQTRAVLSRAKTGADLPRLAIAHFERHPDDSAGNGSLMRTAPVALAHLGHDEAIAEAAREISALTHGDPLAGEACVLWCIAIDRAIREGHLAGVRDGLRQLEPSRRGHWTARLEEAEANPPEAFRKNGYVVVALQAAYSAIHHTLEAPDRPWSRFPDALKAAVRIGNDTDTVAAIAGSLLGARYGVSAIPLAWRQLLHGWPVRQGRPTNARDLVSMAHLAAHGGDPDGDGWPSTPMIPVMDRKFHPRGIALPLPDDPGVLIGDVGGLRGRGGEADVVVSLCRMGPSEVSADEHQEIWLVDKEDRAENPNLVFVFEDTAAFIAARRDEGKTVFVHCVQAESRTPAIAAAYLAHRLGIAGDEALARVHGILPGARPRQAFRAAIQRSWPEASPDAAVVPTQEEGTALTEIASVTLKRGECFGTCPAYEVTFRRNGTALWLGERFTERVGRFKGELPQREFTALARFVERCGFFDWEAEYSEFITDLPTYWLQVERGGQVKAVMQYATDEPPDFWVIAALIDGLCARIQWHGEEYVD